MKPKIDFKALYNAFISGLGEGKDIPYFGENGVRIGTIRGAKLRADHVEVLVELHSKKLVKARIY